MSSQSKQNEEISRSAGMPSSRPRFWGRAGPSRRALNWSLVGSELELEIGTWSELNETSFGLPRSGPQLEPPVARPTTTGAESIIGPEYVSERNVNSRVY